jgi:predicted transcriptional regulator
VSSTNAHRNRGENTKNKVYNYIVSNPGSYFREILRSLNVGQGNLQYILFMLEDEGKIIPRNVGAYKHFYPSDLVENKTNQNILCILSQETPREILVFLSKHPGSCQTDIARYIHSTSPTARWYLIKLESLSLIWSKKEAHEMKYYANTSIQEVARLLAKYRPSIWSKYADRMADLMRIFETDSDSDSGLTGDKDRKANDNTMEF